MRMPRLLGLDLGIWIHTCTAKMSAWEDGVNYTTIQCLHY